MRLVLIAVIISALATASALTDHFSAHPLEIWITRTDQWLFCRDYGVMIQIKAMEPLVINKVEIVAKFIQEDTLLVTTQKRTYSGFRLNASEIKQLSAVFNYCPRVTIDPLILLEIFIYRGNTVWSYQYYIGRALPATYQDLERRIAALTQTVESLKNEIDRLNKRITELQSALRDRESQINQLTMQLTAMGRENEGLRATIQQLTAERESLRRQLEDVRRELSAVAQTKAALESQLAETQRQLTEARDRLDKLSADYGGAQRTIAQLQTQLAELQRQYDQLKRTEAELRDKYLTLTADYNRLEGQYHQLSKAYGELQMEKQILSNRYAELNTGFTWAINLATALGIALAFALALILTRKKEKPAETPSGVKTMAVIAEERLIKWPPTNE